MTSTALASTIVLFHSGSYNSPAHSSANSSADFWLVTTGSGSILVSLLLISSSISTPHTQFRTIFHLGSSDFNATKGNIVHEFIKFQIELTFLPGDLLTWDQSIHVSRKFSSDLCRVSWPPGKTVQWVRRWRRCHQRYSNGHNSRDEPQQQAKM